MRRQAKSFFFIFLLLSALSFSLSSWVYDAKSQPTGIFYNEGAVYMTTLENKLFSINSEDGSLIFSKEFSSELTNPVFYHGSIYIADAGRGIRVLDAKTGNEIRQIPLSGATSLFLHNDALAVQKGGAIFFYNLLTGSLAGKIGAENISGNFRAGFSNDYLAIAGPDSLSLYSLANNSLAWRVPISGTWETSPKITEKGVLVATTDYAVSLHSISNGGKSWEYPLSGWAGADFSVEGDSVFFGTNDNKLYSVSLESGEETWKGDAGGAFQSTPIPAAKMLVAGANDNSLHFFDSKSGEKIASLDLGAWVQHTATDGQSIFAANSEGKAYSVWLDYLCTINEPARDEKTGRALQRVSGRAFAEGGVGAVYASVNEGTWKKAEISGNGSSKAWHYFFDPSQILEGDFSIACKVTGAGGLDERGVYTSITAERTDSAPKKRITMLLPKNAPTSSVFHATVSDGYGNQLSNFRYTWEGETKTGASPLTLSSGSPGKKSLSISAAGYLPQTAQIEIIEAKSDFGALSFILIAAFLVFAYFKFFRKPNRGEGSAPSPV